MAKAVRALWSRVLRAEQGARNEERRANDAVEMNVKLTNEKAELRSRLSEVEQRTRDVAQGAGRTVAALQEKLEAAERRLTEAENEVNRLFAQRETAIRALEGF